MITKRDIELNRLQADLCKAFSDPKRLVIIAELRKGQKSVGDLVRILATPQAVVSRHLGVLRERGVVDARREGTNIFYSLSDPRVCEACDIIQQILLTHIEKNHRLVEKPANF
jgi:DNA-binding transcriptional ArsR family regulator